MTHSRVNRSCWAMLVAAAVISLALSVQAAGPFYDGIVNKEFKRTISLTTAQARHEYTITMVNEGSEAQNHFHLAVQSLFSSKLSYVSASDADGTPLAVKQLEKPQDIVGADGQVAETALIVQVTLKNALKPKDSVTVKASLVFGHTLEPFPHAIAQSERQLVRYRDNHFAFTPYQTKTSTTTIKLASASVQSSSQLEPTSVKGDSIVYGPYTDLKPLSISPLLVHFESNKPFLTVEYLNREIEISMWGNVAIEEFHRWKNDGAELKGGFSRYEFQVNPAASGHAAVKEVSMNIPAIADDVYYRDAIGNISTSHHWKNKLLLIPRFPMFGGWQTKFCMGYNLPAQNYLFQSKSVSGQYTLNITFGPSFDDDVFVDHQKVKIVLPEGATNIKVSYPFSGVKESRETLVTYLDVTGRPVIVLEKNNVVNELNRQYFQVTFSFSTSSFLREPLLLTIGIFVVLVGLIFFSRFNMSIAPEDPKAREELVNKMRGYIKKYKEILSDREDAHNRLDAIVAEGKKSSYETEKPKSLSTLQQKARDVANIIDTVERVSMDMANVMQNIEELEEAFTSSQMALHKAKLDNIGKSATAAGYQVHERDCNEAKKAIRDLVAQLEADL